jgi:CBS domain-containing protein
MQVGEVMSADVKLASPGMGLEEAAALMRDGDFGVLPVGENDRLVGVLTDRDITVRAVAAGKDPSATTVREAMSEGVHWVYEDAPIGETARIMALYQVRRLPVINRDKRLVGVVSLGDLAVEGRDLGLP